MQSFGIDDKKYWQDHNQYERIMNQLRKPQTFVIMVLVCVFTIAGLQLNSMKSDIANLSKELQNEKKEDNKL
jgi:hypothetical protein